MGCALFAQVKNFGRSGRTKYTHLLDQDTTHFDSPWIADSMQNLKFHTSKGGGTKQNFERPSARTAQKWWQCVCVGGMCGGVCVCECLCKRAFVCACVPELLML